MSMSTYYNDEHKLIGTSVTSESGKPPRKPPKNPKKSHWTKLPLVTWFLIVVCSIVFIAELIYARVEAGSAFQTDPFNPMIGPNPYVLINMGSRYTPCMRPSNASQYVYPCLNTTNVDCTLEQICGHDLASGWQWWRLITAMFLHAGFVHIILNMILLYVLGKDLEKELGHMRLLSVYLISGIGGFILSANYAGDNTSSVGASGACFGLIAIELLGLLFNWKLYERPLVNLSLHLIEIVISFVLGLLPGLDNFAHIGGFATGLLTGIIIMHSPLELRLKHKRNPRKKFDVVKFDFSKPLEAFHNRSSLWWVWGLVRVAAFVLLVLFYALLIQAFMSNSDRCSWCKYLSCLPVKGWCDSGYQSV